jgi:ATP adenylyltransferase/5',5'''-P-1,P-4-tetraphosphate phosphorylase II
MKIKFKQDKETILKLLESSNIKKKVKILEKLNGVKAKWCQRERQYQNPAESPGRYILDTA